MVSRPATDTPTTRAAITPWRSLFTTDFCGIGLALGTLLFAASLTPSLVPREPMLQGLLSGMCLACGYGIGALLRWVWRSLQLPELRARARRWGLIAAAVGCGIVAVLTLWWATGWQNRLRELMGMAPIDSAGPFTVAAVALGVFVLLLGIARVAGVIARRLSHRLARYIPGPTAALLGLLATAALFWTLGNGVLVNGAMQSLDSVYAELDGRFEEDVPRPTDPLKSGAPQSLLDWEQLGRQGRQMVAAGPDRDTIARATGRPALEPLRVYVGLNSAETPQQRAQLALRELQRVGAFERSNLVIATPTGSGWVDPQGQQALEYVLGGDVATVAVQYSYLASWVALLADAEYGVETSRAVFSAVYEYWRSLPREQRPRLYLHGLSLGALNSVQSHDLHQVIGDPYQGALWSGPPFNTPTWRTVTQERNPGSPSWLPTFRDGSVIRFTSQQNMLDDAPAPWGPYRVVFLQYASDAVTFFDPYSVWRRPEWLVPPLGPDVSPEMRWIPVVTFVQLAFDMMVAVEPPKGFGHVYAFGHYADAWASLTGPSDWTPQSLDALKQWVAAQRDEGEAGTGP